MASNPLPGPDEISQRVRTEVDRALRRNIKGLEFLNAARADVGPTPRELVHRDGTALVYRYEPQLDEIYRTPLVIVAPPSNKGYIFDLARGQSFVEFMLQRGYDVYLLDWAPPRRDEAHLGLDAYFDRFVPAAIRAAQDISGEEQVSLAGYCMGGVLTTLYTALHPQAVRNLVYFATPIDFTQMTLFRHWSDERWFDLDRVVDELGIIPPDLMMGAFDLARPANRTAGVLNLWTNMWNDDFVQSYRMFDRWAAETLPVPGEYFREQIRKLMWRNELFEGGYETHGRKVELSSITQPLLNITAVHDHVVSYEAAQPLMTMTGSTDRHEIVSKGGHVSLVAGPAALRRLWPHIDTWLAGRST